MRVSGYSFNPRVREGRDKSQAPAVRHICVSIHASARDATFEARRYASVGLFQSTRPRGTRPGLAPPVTRGGVSIHASARDATGIDLLRALGSCFNPRVREGRDI